jgi:hypothetical protein
MCAVYPSRFAVTPALGNLLPMSDESLEGVARGASSILEVVQEFERAGYGGQFAARADGEIECFTCHERMAASEVDSRQLRRLEGASDPDDMLALAALVCSKCGTRGTLVLNYGPTATAEDADVLRQLEPPPPPPA